MPSDYDRSVNQDLQVQPLTGDSAHAAKHTFMPIQSAILRAELPVPFHLYRQNDSGRLRMVLEEGEPVPPDLLDDSELEERRFYIPTDQRGALSAYQGERLSEILESTSVSLDTKCHVLHSQTVLLSQDLFVKPTAPRIAMQRRNVAEMVDFVMQEPGAMRGLLGLTHYDYYTYTHSVNVGLYATWIVTEQAKSATCDDIATCDDLHDVSAGFFLHDIGKCRVAPAIINKPGRLDEKEWEAVRQHPRHGTEILEEEDNLTPDVRMIVLQHHERMDGYGYPRGARGDALYPLARICSLVDAFDALTTRRSYKQALTKFEALKIMKDEMKTQFDPDLFARFVKMFRKSEA